MTRSYGNTIASQRGSSRPRKILFQKQLFVRKRTNQIHNSPMTVFKHLFRRLTGSRLILFPNLHIHLRIRFPIIRKRQKGRGYSPSVIFYKVQQQSMPFVKMNEYVPNISVSVFKQKFSATLFFRHCLLYTSDAADE